MTQQSGGKDAAPAGIARTANEGGPGDGAEPRSPARPAAVPPPREDSLPWSRSHVPYYVLALSLALTFAATVFVAVSGRARDRARFENAVQSTRDRIGSRMETYLAMLHGASGLFAASGTVTREEFRRFVDRLDVHTSYPGVQGIGFARRVGDEQRSALERRMRAEGLDSFRVWPATTGGEHFPIVFLEPLERDNAAVLGFDMYSEATRRRAMERARDTGRPALTGALELIQKIDSLKQVGFLLYVPLYENGVTPTSEGDRRRTIQGFVYSPFAAASLFARIFGSEREPRVDFRVYDGVQQRPADLLFDSRADALRDEGALPFSATEHLAIAGRTWTITFQPTAALTALTGRVFAPFIALIGVMLSIALFVLTRSQVEARGAAERSDLARNRFFAAMSHELRTPLNAIIGYNDLLLGGVFGDLPPEHARGIDRSQKAAKHLLELVNDVLDLSKIEAGKIDIIVETVHLPTLIDDLFATIRPMAESWKCELRFEDRGCTDVIRSDPRRLRQILLNLLSNATKFGRGRPVVVSCSSSHDGAVIEVRDGGPGIPSRDIPRIFDEFVQLPSTPHGGTGLGLPISRRLAQLLGGRLEVDSVPGTGSTFRLRLPAETPHPIAGGTGKKGYARSESGNFRAV